MTGSGGGGTDEEEAALILPPPPAPVVTVPFPKALFVDGPNGSILAAAEAVTLLLVEDSEELLLVAVGGGCAVDRCCCCWLSRLVVDAAMTLEVAISLLRPNLGNRGNWSLKRGSGSLNPLLLGCCCCGGATSGCSLRRCWSKDDCKTTPKEKI